MHALIYIVDSVLKLAVYAFLLRLLLQLTRGDFRNPVSQAIVKPGPPVPQRALASSYRVKGSPKRRQRLALNS